MPARATQPRPMQATAAAAAALGHAYQQLRRIVGRCCCLLCCMLSQRHQRVLVDEQRLPGAAHLAQLALGPDGLLGGRLHAGCQRGYCSVGLEQAGRWMASACRRPERCAGFSMPAVRIAPAGSERASKACPEAHAAPSAARPAMRLPASYLPRTKPCPISHAVLQATCHPTAFPVLKQRVVWAEQGNQAVQRPGGKCSCMHFRQPKELSALGGSVSQAQGRDRQRIVKGEQSRGKDG